MNCQAMKYRSALLSLIDVAVGVLLTKQYGWWTVEPYLSYDCWLYGHNLCRAITNHMINDHLNILVQLRFCCWAANPLPVMDISPTEIEQLFHQWLETAQYLYMPKVIQDSWLYIDYIVGAYHCKIHTNKVSIVFSCFILEGFSLHYSLSWAKSFSDFPLTTKQFSSPVTLRRSLLRMI